MCVCRVCVFTTFTMNTKLKTWAENVYRLFCTTSYSLVNQFLMKNNAPKITMITNVILIFYNSSINKRLIKRLVF